MNTTTKLVCNLGTRYLLSGCVGWFIGRTAAHVILAEETIVSKIVCGIGACVSAGVIGNIIDDKLNNLPPFKTEDGVVMLDDEE